MESFYITSGIRFVLFDSDYKEIISFPETSCEFCRLMKNCPQTRRKCNYADRRSFARCEMEKGLVVYKCHAGLVEAAMPLYDNDKIIAYLMLGQITDHSSKEPLMEKAEELAKKYSLNLRELRESVNKITYKPSEEISAAAKIMEACTSYILLKELITPENNRIIEATERYIEENLHTHLDANEICKVLSVGRTRLYELFRREKKMGVAEYIKRRRLHRGKKLLKATDLSVSEVAERVGFADYNYFSRVFKKHYGKAPKTYRK